MKRPGSISEIEGGGIISLFVLFSTTSVDADGWRAIGLLYVNKQRKV